MRRFRERRRRACFLRSFVFRGRAGEPFFQLAEAPDEDLERDFILRSKDLEQDRFEGDPLEGAFLEGGF